MTDTTAGTTAPGTGQDATGQDAAGQDAAGQDATAQDATGQEPRGRWDLWMMGAGIGILVIFWLVEPFLGPGPQPPEPGQVAGQSPEPVTRRKPPEGWFKGRRGEFLQDRLVAFPQYDTDGVTFDLRNEKQRLEAWLAHGTNRVDVLQDPKLISRFHALGKDQGGRLEGRHLQWFPHLVRVSLEDPRWFEAPYSMSEFKQSGLHRHIVPVFTREEYRAGPGRRRRLLEYVPVNMHARGLTLEDYDLTRSYTGNDPTTGQGVFRYHLKPAAAKAYAKHSGEFIGYESAILVDGYVEGVPHYLSAITSPQGQLQLRTRAAVERLVQDIRKLLPPR